MPQDAHHLVSHRWIRRYLEGGGQLVAPLLLLVEVGGAVARQSGQPAQAQQAVAILLRLPAMRWVALNNRLARMATQFAIDLRLRGADAVYVAAASHLNIPLITWDQEQVDRAGAHITVRTPDAPDTDMT
jgi:predicted nucleic acid-binding protein